MSTFLDKLGRNFLIATFIPSLGFVLICSYLFAPILPFEVKDSLSLLVTGSLPVNTQLLGTAGFLFVLTLLLGYTLRGLETFNYKVLEGYSLFHSPHWQKRQRRKAQRRLLRIKYIDFWIDQLYDKHTEDNKLKELIEKLEQMSFNLKAEYKLDYPSEPLNAMPTRFGNILRSAETYPNEHYGIDAVLMWPRLIQVIDPSYYNQIDQSNNSLAFIVNSMVLSLILAALCLLASVYQFTLWQVVIPDYERQVAEFIDTNVVFPSVAYQEAHFSQLEPLYFLSVSVTTQQRLGREKRPTR